MSQEEQDRILGRLMREQKELHRRINCQTSRAREIEILMNALNQPWGLYFDDLRKERKHLFKLTVGEIFDSIENDVASSGDLKRQIDSILNPSTGD